MMRRQFTLFLVAGGLAACVNIGSRMILSIWIAYVPAIVLAYLAGMATAFGLNKLFVFRGAQRGLGAQAFWFTLVNMAAVLQTIGISLLLSRWLLPWMGITSHVETVAHIVGVGVPVITSYFGHKYLSFSTR